MLLRCTAPLVLARHRLPIRLKTPGVQTHPRVAFEGELGAFSEEAIAALWPKGADPIPSRTVLDVARATSTGAVDAGVLPVENTVAGSVVGSYDALAKCPDLHAIAEAILPIRQCLMAPVGATLDTVEVVESHPVALAQCAVFLSRHQHIKQVAASDTAGAARAVAGAGDRKRAAIASKAAAARYELAILKEGIEDRPDNQTRFLAVSRTPATVEAGRPARTSLIFTTANEPGSLIRALAPLAELGLNLSKLESRPTGEPWTYRFFADVDHTGGDSRRDEALQAMTEAAGTLRILGTYARAAN